MLSSCASVPKTGISWDEQGRELFLLPSGGKVYLWADTVAGRPIIDVLSFGGLNAADAAQVLDRTSTAGGVIFNEGLERRFFLAASGKYPRGGANFSLAFSRGWKKLKSPTGNNYWFSQGNKLALSIGSDLAFISDADPWGNAQGTFSHESPPDKFMEFRSGFTLAGWVNDSSESINKFMDSVGIPIQIPAEEFFFGAALSPPGIGTAENTAAFSAANQSIAGAEIWELVLKMKMPSANHARSILALFSMARTFMNMGSVSQAVPGIAITPQQAGALLFANAPTQEGEYLTLRTGRLSAAGIALLFQMFSVNS